MSEDSSEEAILQSLWMSNMQQWGVSELQPTHTEMYLCYGQAHHRFPMYIQETYLPEPITEALKQFLDSDAEIFLEYSEGQYTRVYNEEELALASRIVTENHNALHRLHIHGRNGLVP